MFTKLGQKLGISRSSAPPVTAGSNVRASAPPAARSAGNSLVKGQKLMSLIDTLTKKCDLLQTQIDNERKMMKELMSQKTKKGEMLARQHHEKNKRYQAQYKTAKAQLDTAQAALQTLVDQENNMDLLEAIEESNKLTKKMSIEKADKIMDDARNAKADVDEITRLTTEGIGSEELDDGSFEDELADIMNDAEIEEDASLTAAKALPLPKKKAAAPLPARRQADEDSDEDLRILEAS